MQTISKNITLATLNQMAERKFGSLVKAVVDIQKKVMVVDAALHADQEAELLRQGSQQENLWGINLYPELFGSEDFVEFDSMINIRPGQDNFSRDVENKELRKKILLIVDELVSR